MNRTARDKSERHFLYFIMVMVLILLILVVCDIPKLGVLIGLSFILGSVFFRGFHLFGRPEGDVIRRIERDK